MQCYMGLDEGWMDSLWNLVPLSLPSPTSLLNTGSRTDSAQPGSSQAPYPHSSLCLDHPQPECPPFSSVQQGEVRVRGMAPYLPF